MNKRNRGTEFDKVSAGDLQLIIVDGDPQKLVETAESVGKQLAHQLSTSQIRAIFGEVRQIEAEWPLHRERAERSLILLKPKMAYRAKRESGQGVKNLVGVLDPAVDLVTEGKEDKDQRFNRFVEFFEAILAYHKAYGGR